VIERNLFREMPFGITLIFVPGTAVFFRKKSRAAGHTATI